MPEIGLCIVLTKEWFYAYKSTKQKRNANFELFNSYQFWTILKQVFHSQIIKTNREHQMFPDNVIPRIFSNIKSIYQFHNDFLLPQLEKRMVDW